MKHYQNEEMYACPKVENASQRNSQSQVPLNGEKMTVTAAVNNGKSHSLKFLREGSVQSSPNGFPSGDAALQTKQGMTTEPVGFSDCDKEMFKRTILAHEAVFRQQVHWHHYYINILKFSTR